MKKKEEEKKVKKNSKQPPVSSTYWSFNRFLKTDIEEDNFTLSSIVFHTDGT